MNLAQHLRISETYCPFREKQTEFVHTSDSCWTRVRTPKHLALHRSAAVVIHWRKVAPESCGAAQNLLLLSCRIWYTYVYIYIYVILYYIIYIYCILYIYYGTKINIPFKEMSWWFSVVKHPTWIHIFCSSFEIWPQLSRFADETNRILILYMIL